MKGDPTARRPRKSREQRRLRIRRRGRRAYIRSVYSLPSLATLGNAICGFAAMYVAAGPSTNDYRFSIAAYLIFGAMFFDAIDGRLARFARHTTDFGGQLDSLADVISFGAAPAYISLILLKEAHGELPSPLANLIWAIGALYLSCAALRLARFNVSNEHGEQHHFSFLGLPSPAAGGVVAGWVLMQQELARQAAYLRYHGWIGRWVGHLSSLCVWTLPIIVLMSGLLMISHIRYPHLVNRYLRGRRSFERLILVVIGLLALVIAHQYAIGIGMLIYVLSGAVSAGLRLRRRAVGG